MKILYFIFCTILIQGCSSTTFTPTKFNSDGSALVFAPIPQGDVKIYKLTKVSGTEIGVVSDEGEGANVEKTYEKFRKIASEKGANYVIDFSLKVDSRSVTSTKQHCTGAGPSLSCTSQIVTETKHYYKALGSLIRKEE